MGGGAGGNHLETQALSAFNSTPSEVTPLDARIGSVIFSLPFSNHISNHLEPQRNLLPGPKTSTPSLIPIPAPSTKKQAVPSFHKQNPMPQAVCSADKESSICSLVEFLCKVPWREATLSGNGHPLPPASAWQRLKL